MSAIPTDPNNIRPLEVSRALAGLKGILVVHLSLQDGMLYPWMSHHDAPIVRQAATHHRQMMKKFLLRFLNFYGDWQSAEAIEADRRGFALAWHVVQTTLLYRLEAEASDLYRVVETYGNSYAIA